MKNKALIIAVGMGLFLLGAFTIKIFDDPYYHVEKVTFAEWVYREIDELLHGER